MRTRLFENPVALRELGWAYYPPFLGRIPRKKAQAGALIFFVVGFVILGYFLERRFSGAAPITLLSFAMLGALALMVRCLVAGFTAWRKERELGTVQELILTRLTSRDLAEAHVFARGFVFILGSWVVTGLFLAGLWLDHVWGNHFMDSEAVPFFSTLALLFPPLISNVYLRLLRASLLQRWVIPRVLISGFLWALLLPLGLLLLTLAILLLGDHYLEGNIVMVHLAILFVGINILTLWILAGLAYQHLVTDIETIYLENATE